MVIASNEVTKQSLRSGISHREIAASLALFIIMDGMYAGINGTENLDALVQQVVVWIEAERSN
jgi:hypothetical protein